MDRGGSLWEWDAGDLSLFLHQFESVDLGREVPMRQNKMVRRRLVTKSFRGYTYLPIVPMETKGRRVDGIQAMTLRDFLQAGMVNDDAKEYIDDIHLVEKYSNKSLRFPNGYVITNVEDNNIRGIGDHPVIKKLKGK